MAEPDEYYKSTTIRLYHKSKTDSSVDEAGAIKYSKSKTKKLANTHGTWVQQAQKDLITLGYLAATGSDKAANDDGYYGPGSVRAVKRFQRHAGRVFRMDSAKAAKDVKPAEVLKAKEPGVIDPDTAKEMRKWIDNKWVLPLGRFKPKELSAGLGGRLREDAAIAWEKVVADVHAKGGILIGVYGDTLRPFRKTAKVGTSGYSFHYCGRAVDISQRLANPHGMIYEGIELSDEGEKAKCKKLDPNNVAFFIEEIEKYKTFGKVKKTGKRYFLGKEEISGKTWWKIHCRTMKQDGTQGVKKAKGDITCYDLSSNTTYKNPEGYYINLTDAIQAGGTFERIKAHDGWDKNTNKTEWWHFQYKLDKSETFQDELELIGITEKEMDDAGWNTDAAKDHAPG